MDIKQLLNKDIGGLPAWVWGIAGLGGIGLGYYFYSRAKAGSTATSTTDNISQGQQVDSGLGSYAASGPNAGSAQPTGATINIGVPATPTNWLTSIILANHPVNEYASAGTPGGLPDAVIATIPGNSTVQATGPEVVGAWNIPNGSELWYPVTYNGIPGFVSAYDVVNSSTTIGTTPVTPPPVHPPGKTYTITSADMKLNGPLHQIAKRFGITYDALFNANSPTPLGTDKNHAKFNVGTVLTIPTEKLTA